MLLLELFVLDLSESLGRGWLGTHLHSLGFGRGLRLRLLIEGPRELVLPLILVNLLLLLIEQDFLVIFVVHHEKFHQLLSDFVSLGIDIVVATHAGTNTVRAAVQVVKGVFLVACIQIRRTLDVILGFFNSFFPDGGRLDW